MVPSATSVGTLSDNRNEMAKKLRVGILFGGRSGEHEVSLLSAASVLKAIDREKFDVVPIGITKEGRWLAAGDAHNLLEGNHSEVVRRLRAGDPEATPGAKLLQEGIPTLMAPEPGGSTALNRSLVRAARHSMSSFLCCMAPSAKTEPSRGYSNWPASPMWVPVFWARRRAWTRT